jgi:PST family polysaccharide transporter
VSLAYLHYGVWSLVAHELVSVSVECLLCLIVVRWYPRLSFSWEAFKECLPFAGNMSGTKVMTYIVDNIDFLVIGRAFGPATLGLYTMAYRLAVQPVRASTTPLGQALFPVYARVSSENERLSFYFATSLRILAVILVPAAIILASAPELVVRVLLGDQWSPTIPLLRMFSLLILFDAVRRMVQGVFIAKHRERDLLRIRGVAALLVSVSMVLAAALLSFYAVVLVYIISNIVLAIVQLRYVLRFMETPGRLFLTNILKDYWAMAGLLGAVVLLRLSWPEALWPITAAGAAYVSVLGISTARRLRSVFAAS